MWTSSVTFDRRPGLRLRGAKGAKRPFDPRPFDPRGQMTPNDSFDPEKRLKYTVFGVRTFHEAYKETDMKKKLIALALSIVLASGSAGAVPAFAVESTAEEAVAAEEAAAEEAAAEETVAAEEAAAAEEIIHAAEEIVSTAEEEPALEVEETDYEEESFDMRVEPADSAMTEEIAAEEDSAIEGPDENRNEIIEEPEIEAVSADAKGTVVQSGSCGANVDWTWDNAGILTISGTGPMKDYNWTNPWADLTVKKVIIKEGVTHIGEHAFGCCMELTSVTIPETVTSIGDYAFRICNKLTSVKLPKNLTTIGNFAFYQCSKLVSVVIPDKVTSIGEYAFSSCENLTGVAIPKGVTEIKDRTFDCCYKLNSVELKNVESIGAFAFVSCNSLSKITISDNLKRIGEGAFYGCWSLASIALPEGLTYIGPDAFCWCAFTRITIPSTVENVDHGAFFDCKNLTTLIIRKGVKKISYRICENCDNMATVYYIGTQTDWLAMTVSTDNDELLNAKFVFIEDPYDLKFAAVTGLTTATYTGNPITPSPVVEQLGVTLKKGTDYKVTYSNNAKIGKAKVTITGIGKYHGSVTKTFSIVLGKTTRGDMFNLANNVKVTWKAVTGAKYYKVYRSGVKEPVIVTTGLVGWDKSPGLKNGQKYTYKIVASLTGKGDASGDSPLSYSKVMYRLKTVVIRSAKNTAPGKVTVKYDRTEYGDSYVLQYCEREDMVGAKTKVVLGASNTSYVIGGLKKGKTYYISIRVRKKVNGIDYYTTFGVAKKVTITQ